MLFSTNRNTELLCMNATPTLIGISWNDIVPQNDQTSKSCCRCSMIVVVVWYKKELIVEYYYNYSCDEFYWLWKLFMKSQWSIMMIQMSLWFSHIINIIIIIIIMIMIQIIYQYHYDYLMIIIMISYTLS